MAVGTALVLIVIVLMGVVHGAIVTRILGRTVTEALWIRVPGNVVMVVLMPTLALVCGAHRASRVWGALRSILPAAVLASVARGCVLLLAGAWTGDLRALWLAEGLGGMTICVCAALLGYFYVRSQRALRVEERLSGERATQRELALRTLETEEVRVRRSIAEGLHGSLQQRLVVQSIRLEIMIRQAQDHAVAPEIVESMRELRDEIDLIREHDVREMSRMLYPEGIEVGMVPAIRILLRRLPPGIATSFDVSDEVRTVDDPAGSLMSQATRLLAVRFVEEAVTNGLRHGHATAFAVTVDLVGRALRIEVANDGSAIDPAAVETGTGLRRLGERFALAGGRVDVVPTGSLDKGGAAGAVGLAGADGSVRLRAALPLGGVGGVVASPRPLPIGG
ncbi:Signal transduction histidine kinase [Sanguibacter gelidistatuariae]|uniref:Signal transduction histidine kinase n=2 Tax=Sanguibacter gelidistatuariae TaxID=1814289 RepID=A0A1G6TLJ4_9MICO|nr:Signal transduction histidine kinase [Sanguibacter gelidistatuariae]